MSNYSYDYLIIYQEDVNKKVEFSLAHCAKLNSTIDLHNVI